MKALALVLALVCGAVGATDSQPDALWNMVASVPSKGLTFWQHKVIAQSGEENEIRHATDLVNFFVKDRDSMSYINATQYDCKTRKYRILEQIWFSDWWALGKIMHRIDNQDADWKDVPSGSPAATALIYVCSFKGA
jgi:hypothetical protein